MNAKSCTFTCKLSYWMICKGIVLELGFYELHVHVPVYVHYKTCDLLNILLYILSMVKRLPVIDEFVKYIQVLEPV